LLVTRSAWELVGGFDERYFPAYFEDVDLCLAMAEHGLRIRYEPQALLTHQGSQSTSVGFRGFLLHRNQRKLVDKWGSTLDSFEPPPTKASGPVFEAAVRRANDRTRARVHSASALAVAAPSVQRQRAASDDPTQAAADLRADYEAYLEERVAEGDKRVRVLENYLSGLWGVRLRRRVGGWLHRQRR